ncbi:MAG: response regulator [Lachnospiraceae bacterium]|nr:response regulator [Lachnospiraceae bacterium]
MKENFSEEEICNQIGSLIWESCDAVIQIDTDDGQAQTLYAKDDLWGKTIGNPYDFIQILGTYIRDYCVDAETRDLLEKIDLSFVVGKIRRKDRYSLFFTIRNAYGSLLLKECFFFMQGESLVCLIKDVTDEKNTISKRLEKLEDALRMTNREFKDRNSFLNLMEHNIRTPLYSIMGLTRLAQDETNSSALDAYLHKISMSGTYMSETIDDILELRRIARHKLVVNPEPVKLGEFLSKIQQYGKAMGNERELIFSLKTDEVSNLAVLVDEHALYQVIMKLMQNAMNYTVRGGRISLNVRKVYIKDGFAHISFSMESRGIVIDREQLQTIFAPQDKLIERIEDNIGSMDLSLVIFKSYLMALGTNEIVAESDESMGTKVGFSLTFPLTGSVPEQEKFKSRTIQDHAGCRALIVDDNTFSREVGEKILLSGGMDVVSAANGQEAVEIFLQEKGKFDVIIMDILMPVMDGLEAARTIRSFDAAVLPHAAEIPIIAMTADAFRENFEESLNAGMNAHIVKPLTPEKLFRTIADVMAQKGKSTV